MARNTILLKGDLNQQDEARAGGTVKPGYLAIRNSSGQLIAHNQAGGGAGANQKHDRLIVMEDGKIGLTVNSSYASGDLVPFYKAYPSNELQVVLKQGQNAANDAPLTSNGDGTFKVAGAGDWVYCHAMEALDLSAAGADGFVAVRFV